METNGKFGTRKTVRKIKILCKKELSNIFGFVNRFLQKKLDQPATAPPSPMDFSCSSNCKMDQPEANDSNSSPLSLAMDIVRLRGEVMQLKQRFRISQAESNKIMVLKFYKKFIYLN